MPPKDDIFGVKEYGVLVERGKAAYRQGRFMEAIQAWRGAQAVDPSRRKELAGYLEKATAKQVAMHLQNAERFEAGGDAEQAVAQYKLILQLGPKDPALMETASEKVRAFEVRAETMSTALLASVAAGFLVLVLLILWFILRLD